MTKQEFLNDLGGKLSEGMSRQELMSQLQYYAGYIDGEKARGKSEEEAIEDLGDPILIARTILESPREEDTFFGHIVQSEEEAYFEGSYQGENQLTTAEIKAAAAADEMPDREVERSDDEAESEAEETSENEADETEEADADEAEGADARGEADSANETAKRAEAHMKEDQKVKTGFMLDEAGKFRWDLFGVLLGLLLALTAVIYLAVKVLSALGPVLIGILVAGIIAYFVYRSLH